MTETPKACVLHIGPLNQDALCDMCKWSIGRGYVRGYRSCTISAYVSKILYGVFSKL